jgi:hypothetical protein
VRREFHGRGIVFNGPFWSEVRTESDCGIMPATRAHCLSILIPAYHKRASP